MQQLGAEVIGVDRQPPMQTVGDFIAADLGSPAAIAELVARLPGRMDALCNVAGVSGAAGIASTLAVNFYGLRALTDAVAPQLREGGAVVNVASIAGFGWRANLARARALVDIAGFPDDTRESARRSGGSSTTKSSVAWPGDRSMTLTLMMSAPTVPSARRDGAERAGAVGQHES